MFSITYNLIDTNTLLHMPHLACVLSMLHSLLATIHALFVNVTAFQNRDAPVGKDSGCDDNYFIRWRSIINT